MYTHLQLQLFTKDTKVFRSHIKNAKLGLFAFGKRFKDSSCFTMF